ncbi:MAG: sigma-70 family RNA polymerase sigma factor [Clostridiales bacterium]|nr:sigma-70 family RNA polymerase sigma factor [Clostridiales bacterium]
MTDEEKLLINLKKRRRGSLEKAVDIYTPYVSVIVYNIIGGIMTKEDVEEAVSDVFVSLWKSAGELDVKKGCIRTYLGALARNCARKKLRGFKGAYAQLDESAAASEEELCARLELDEERAMLLELIKDLGEPDCEIFLRYYWYNERISKISDVTGICKSTITTKLQRGRKKLKEILTKREERQ